MRDDRSHSYVSIGTRLPDTVRFHPLPPRIVEIYPEWGGYEVVRIHGRYVIVKPDTREIVYINCIQRRIPPANGLRNLTHTRRENPSRTLCRKQS